MTVPAATIVTLDHAETEAPGLTRQVAAAKVRAGGATAARRRHPALCAAAENLSAERARHLPPHQMGAAARHPRRLLCAAVRALGPRPERADAGGADRSVHRPLLFLLHRDLAAGGLLHHRPADPGVDRPVPDERGRRPGVVRLSLPADGVDRSVLRHRALGRRRPARAHAARRPQMDGAELTRARR